MTFSIKHEAEELADKANECCYRSDGYKKDIAKLAEQSLFRAMQAGREEAAVWHDMQAFSCNSSAKASDSEEYAEDAQRAAELHEYYAAAIRQLPTVTGEKG